MLMVYGQAQRRAAFLVKHKEEVRASVELDLQLIQRPLVSGQLMQDSVAVLVY